jgi:hypothetical protein
MNSRTNDNCGCGGGQCGDAKNTPPIRPCDLPPLEALRELILKLDAVRIDIGNLRAAAAVDELAEAYFALKDRARPS